MSGFVGLDPVAASTLADHLDEAAVDLEARADRVARLLAQADISASNAPAEIRDVAAWARYRSRDMRRRIAEITAAARGGSGVQLRGFLLADRSEARTAGRDLGKKVGGLLGSGDKKKLDAALAALKRYGNDPAYAAGFFKGLGPARTYALLVATAGRDTGTVIGSALVLARRTGGITVRFIDGIVTAARKAAMAVQAYTGAMPKELRVAYATDEYVRRAGSQHPTLTKYLEAIAPLTPYLEAGAKVAVIGGAVVVVTTGAVGLVGEGAVGLGATIEVLAGSGPIDAQALQELEAQFGDISVQVVADDGMASELAGSLRSVNVLGGTQNCVNCVVAGDATLSGSPASALDSLGPQPISKLEAMFGGTFKDVAGEGEIKQLLNEAGSGARGIVYGAREGAAGHVFLAVNQGGIVRFLDPQTGGVASFDGYVSFKFLWTNGP